MPTGLKPPVIVVTMGHTGSSALMQILAHNGLFTGNLDRSPWKDFWENVYFQGYNKAWLKGKEFDLEGHDVPPILDPGPLRVEAEMVMRGQGLTDEFWGWKDPRNTWTLDNWLKIFPEARCIFLDRRKEDVLHDREGYAAHPGLYEVWHEQFKRKLHEMISRGIPTVDLHYDDLTNHFEGTLEPLLRFLGLPLPKDVEESKKLWKPKYHWTPEYEMEYWDGHPRSFHLAKMSKRVEQFDLKPAGRVMDIGGGPLGGALPYIQAKRHILVDLLADRCNLPDVEKVVADFANIPFGDCTMDAVIAWEVLDHAHSKEHFKAGQEEMQRIVAPGGYLYFLHVIRPQPHRGHPIVVGEDETLAGFHLPLVWRKLIGEGPGHSLYAVFQRPR